MITRRPLIFTIVLAIAAAVVAYLGYVDLQNDSYESHEIEKAGKADKSAKKGQRGSKENPLVVDLLPAPDKEAQSARERKEQRERSVNERRIAWGTIALAVFTFALACFTAYLWSSTSDLVEKTEKATYAIERAYIKLSPFDAPDFGTTGDCRTVTRATNFGNTPARVTDVVVAIFVGSENVAFPNEPIAKAPAKHEATKAFLVKDEPFNTETRFTIHPNAVADIKSGKRKLWTHGYVDYIDVFGQRHRGGFAREYRFTQPIGWMFTDRPGHDYDRKRERGEGNDWDEA